MNRVYDYAIDVGWNTRRLMSTLYPIRISLLDLLPKLDFQTSKIFEKKNISQTISKDPK